MYNGFDDVLLHDEILSILLYSKLQYILIAIVLIHKIAKIFNLRNVHFYDKI